MKTIYCIRHAKSDWGDFSLPDHDRPLSDRGIRDAPIMAAQLAQIIDSVDIALVSTALRAQETASYFISALKVGATDNLKKIYHADVGTLEEVIMEIDDAHSTAIMFGHNPGFTYLYNEYSSVPLDNLPTCGIYRLTIRSDRWSEMTAKNTHSDQLMYPKMYL